MYSVPFVHAIQQNMILPDDYKRMKLLFAYFAYTAYVGTIQDIEYVLGIYHNV